MQLWIYLIFKSRSQTTLTKTSQDLPNRNTRNLVVFLACCISSYSRPSQKQEQNFKFTIETIAFQLFVFYNM